MGIALRAQNIERHVLATAGGFGEQNGVSVSWTLGEAATATLADGTIVLTQGFQQPGNDTTTTAVGQSIGNFIVKIYPNPAGDALTLELPLEMQLQASLSDAAGRTLAAQVVSGTTASFDVSQLPAAAYFLRLSDGKSWVKTVKILKD